MAKKTAVEHIQDTTKQSKIVHSLPAGVKWAHEGASMVVSTPMEINQLMSGVPAGKLTTSERLRQNLAKHYKIDYTCPLSTGIFINIAGKAAVEMLDTGAKLNEVTPYWRTLKTGGALNPKFPGGLESHAAKLEAEGFTIIKKSKTNWLVDNFERFLVQLISQIHIDYKVDVNKIPQRIQNKGHDFRGETQLGRA